MTRVTYLDPQQMSPAERKAEIAALLSTGFLRALARKACLASTGESEPSCASVNGRESDRAPAAGPEQEASCSGR